MSLQYPHTHRTSFQPLPGIRQARPLDVAEHHLPEGLDMSAANQLADQDDLALLVAILAPWDAVDITPDEPWRMGGRLCAWKSNDPTVHAGWRLLCLPSIDGHPYTSDQHSPRLHLTPEGGVIYEPGPYGDDPEAPALIPVDSLDQLLELLGRIAPFAEVTL